MMKKSKMFNQEKIKLSDGNIISLKKLKRDLKTLMKPSKISLRLKRNQQVQQPNQSKTD